MCGEHQVERREADQPVLPRPAGPGRTRARAPAPAPSAAPARAAGREATRPVSRPSEVSPVCPAGEVLDAAAGGPPVGDQQQARATEPGHGCRPHGGIRLRPSAGRGDTAGGRRCHGSGDGRSFRVAVVVACRHGARPAGSRGLRRRPGDPHRRRRRRLRRRSPGARRSRPVGGLGDGVAADAAEGRQADGGAHEGSPARRSARGRSRPRRTQRLGAARGWQRGSSVAPSGNRCAGWSAPRPRVLLDDRRDARDERCPPLLERAGALPVNRLDVALPADPQPAAS